MVERACKTTIDHSSASTDAEVVAGVRLLLTAIALAAHVHDLPQDKALSSLTLAVLLGYLLYSIALLAVSCRFDAMLRVASLAWIDVAWYAALVAVDPANSVLLPFFLFAVVVASFRCGFVEGGGIALFSALPAGFAALSATLNPDVDWHHLPPRIAFLIAIGLFIAYWGGRENRIRRRLALLKDIGLLANPRFGVNQTIASVMRKLCKFYGGDCCTLVLHDPRSGCYFIRRATPNEDGKALQLHDLPAEIGARLLADPAFLIQYSGNLLSRLSGRFPGRTYDLERRKRVADAGACGESIANLLDAVSYASAPLFNQRYAGRIYISSASRSFLKDDMFFLHDAALAATAMIDTIDLLDRLATDAATEERRRLVNDLHDTALQPYIGLKMGLEAVRARVSPGDVLAEPIERLTLMTEDVIHDLRRYVMELKLRRPETETALVAGARRQALQFHEHYGITVTVHAGEQIEVNDRLAIQALQIVKEGLNNIRKHTDARSAAIRFFANGSTLMIHIENEREPGSVRDFSPRSIVERSAALGGRAWVTQHPCSATVVHVEIPL